jgi:hypothetical protein
MEHFEDPLYRKIVEQLPAGTKPADFIASVEVQAHKPGGECCDIGCCKE